MLAKIAPRFVISRVIQNSYFAENQAVNILKCDFVARDEHFSLIDSQNYQVCKFYGYISTLSKPSGFANKYEEQAYDFACLRFKTFSDTLETYDKLAQFFSEVRMIYNYIERNNSSSNFFSQSIEVNKTFESDILTSIEKYKKLEQGLAPYPEWQEKVKQEIGGLYHIIYNNLAESSLKRNVFSKLNHQEYFL